MVRKEEFLSLAKDLYSEGYQSGISGVDADKWFEAWAMAMEKVANGEAYTDSLVEECFNSI